MISPSGVKMRKEVTQQEVNGKNGNPMTVYNIRWKPVSVNNDANLTQKRPGNTPENQVYYPQNTTGRGLSPFQPKPEIKKIRLSKKESPMKNPNNFEIVKTNPQIKSTIPSNLENYKIYQSKEEMEKTDENNPYGNHKENKLDLSCPIEDPRNPFHEEYLKLKAMYDGKLINGKEYKKNSPPQPKLIVKKINSNEKNPKTTTEFNSNPEDEKWVKVKDPEILNQYFAPVEGRKTSQTVKKEYPHPSQKSVARPPTIVIEAPLSNSNSDTPTKVNEYKKPMKVLNQYHYCKDCDVAYQPLQEGIERHVHAGDRVIGKRGFSPYTPPVYSPDDNLYQDGEFYGGVVDENRGDFGNVMVGGFGVGGKRPQLVKSKKRPSFGGF